jgi:hypothetical protein
MNLVSADGQSGGGTQPGHIQDDYRPVPGLNESHFPQASHSFGGGFLARPHQASELGLRQAHPEFADVRREVTVEIQDVDDDASDLNGDVVSSEIETTVIRPVKPVGDHEADRVPRMRPARQEGHEGVPGDRMTDERRARSHGGAAGPLSEHADLSYDVSRRADSEQCLDTIL